MFVFTPSLLGQKLHSYFQKALPNFKFRLLTTRCGYWKNFPPANPSHLEKYLLRVVMLGGWWFFCFPYRFPLEVRQLLANELSRFGPRLSGRSRDSSISRWEQLYYSLGILCIALMDDGYLVLTQTAFSFFRPMTKYLTPKSGKLCFM